MDLLCVVTQKWMHLRYHEFCTAWKSLEYLTHINASLLFKPQLPLTIIADGPIIDLCAYISFWMRRMLLKARSHSRLSQEEVYL